MPADSQSVASLDVTVSIVSFNTRELLAGCLRSVFASAGLAHEVHVIDNGSSDGSAAMVARDFPSAMLTRTGVNRGFAAANNYAIREARGRYVLLLNPDTVVSSSTLARMVAFMDARPEVGICGPKILLGDGSFQSCGYRFPTLRSELRQAKNLGKLLRRLVGVEPTLRMDSEPFPVDWVDGACLLIRRETLRDVGPLDEQFFLYAEELDWCFRARKSGWQIFALPDIEMTHYQGQSSSQMSDFSLAHFIETRLRYYRKNHGLATAALISLVYAVGSLKRLNDHRSRVKLQATIRWWRALGAA